MAETPAIPDFVWRALLALIERLFWPAVMAFAVLGVLVAVVWWKKGNLPFLSKKTPDHHQERRRNLDPLLEQVIRQNAENTSLMIQVVRDNTAAMQSVAGRGEELAHKMDRYHDAIKEGFSVIHGRINTALERVR